MPAGIEVKRQQQNGHNNIGSDQRVGF
jgi:hypothetical protein